MVCWTATRNWTRSKVGGKKEEGNKLGGWRTPHTVHVRCQLQCASWRVRTRVRTPASPSPSRRRRRRWWWWSSSSSSSSLRPFSSCCCCPRWYPAACRSSLRSGLPGRRSRLLPRVVLLLRVVASPSASSVAAAFDGVESTRVPVSLASVCHARSR